MEWSFSTGAGNFQIDIHGDGIPDFAFSGGVTAGSISRGLVDVGSLFFMAIHGGILPGPQAPGALIGPQDKFLASTAADFEHIDLYRGGSSTFLTGGPWLNKSGYLGFRFTTSGGQFHYGWADFGISVSSDGRAGEAFFGPYAYDTVPDQSIRAGQTSATPEPGTLGLLALGALGLGLWRRKKQEAVTSDK